MKSIDNRGKCRVFCRVSGVIEEVGKSKYPTHRREPLLTNPKIAHAPAKEKPYKLKDAHGLYVLVTPSRGRLWRYRYRFSGKVKDLALGEFPSVSLAQARLKRDAAKALLNDGRDPAVHKAAEKALRARRIDEQFNMTFEGIARTWHEQWSSNKEQSTSATTIRRLEKNVFPWMGQRFIGEIDAPEILAVLRRIEARGILESARRIKIIIGQVFRFAVSTGLIKHDPSAILRDNQEVLKTPTVKHMAAVTDPKEIPALLRAIDSYSGSFIVKCALQFQALTFVRPGELRHAEWSEIDFDAAQWAIPANKMKMKQPHIVPLSRQSVEILKELRPLTSTRGKYVFPSHRSATRPMSENTVNAALRRMDIEKDKMCGHGFRAMARTILDEVLQVRPEFIEHQLAHAVKDPNGRAYNRTAHLDERKKMMQLWANYLDGLKTGTKVTPFPKSRTPRLSRDAF
jgi:integrase